MENTSISIKLAIVDVDGMIYHSLRDNFVESLMTFEDKFQNLLEKTEATHYVGFYSQGKYFRHDIDPEYKGNRSGKPIPKYFKPLKEWVIAEFGFQQMKKAEADDLCAYWMNENIGHAPEDSDKSFDKWKILQSAKEYLKEGGEEYNIEKCEHILCTPDKDLLQSIPGKHFNYTYKLTDEAKQAKKADPKYETKEEDVIKGWWIATTPNIANNFRNMQLIIGDSGDGIKGVEGLGIKAWDKMINSGMTLIHDILIKYIQKYGQAQGVFEFQKNYRLLHMLDCDEDFMREVGEIPTFPNIIKVEQPEETVEEIEEKF
jgi:5'-3' exonuclease